MRIQLLMLAFVAIMASSCTSTEGGGNSQDGEEKTPQTEVASTAYDIKVTNADLPSPRKEMEGMLNGKKVVVDFGSPSVKNRPVLGGLAPYGKVWRTGANEATTITFEETVKFGNNQVEVPAGTYGLFTMPGESDWIIILNSVSDQWGAYDYDERKDILRDTVKVEMVEDHQEQMEFWVENDMLILRWEKFKVPVKIG